MKSSKRKYMVLRISLSLVALIAAAIFAFIHRPGFGRLPRGERLERILRSPNYRDGAFHNLQSTPMITSGKSRVSTMLGFLFREKTNGLRPESPVPAVKTDLRAMNPSQNALVWFGHSSYLIQIDGKRILVDPVFCTAAPLAFVNEPFEGTDIYRPCDMPDIDYLVISHDHWDHLDYKTVKQLRERIGKVICPLGVGEHFERWGFAPQQLIEMDWQQTDTLDTDFTVHCLPARHFSGRGFRANKTLWASFLIVTPSMKIYMAGDGGYGTHFAEIGKQFPDIGLAILENGQYNPDWRYIHTLPEQLSSVAKELQAAQILTVHHSKYALARHPWDEPLKNEQRLREDSLNVVIPAIGEVVDLEGIYSTRLNK